MKLVTFVASTVIGVVSLAPAAFAQGENHAALEVSRVPETGVVGASSSRVAQDGPAAALTGNRPASGMFPQPSGPLRGISGAASAAPATGGDVRHGLRVD
jgi:hypothetical protein